MRENLNEQEFDVFEQTSIIEVQNRDFVKNNVLPFEKEKQKLMLASSLNGSDSKEVLEWATDFAKSINAKLEIVHVVEPGSVWNILLNMSTVEQSIGDRLLIAKKKMEEFIGSCDQDSNIHTHLTCTDVEDIAEKIITFAKENAVGIIILESHQMKMHSVIFDKLMRESGKPVLIYGRESPLENTEVVH